MVQIVLSEARVVVLECWRSCFCNWSDVWGCGLSLSQLGGGGGSSRRCRWGLGFVSRSGEVSPGWGMRVYSM